MENNIGNLYAGDGVVLSLVVIVDAVGQELIHHLGHVGGDPFHLKIMLRSDKTNNYSTINLNLLQQ